MLQPENQSKKYESLFSEIDSGRTKIPMFQRDFVWTKEQTAQLIDSIIKGYPIGTFIIWKTHEELRAMRNIGNINLPEIPKGDAAYYVLDGQQRITSLYAVRKGAVFNKEGQVIDYKQLSINLDVNPDVDDQVVTIEPPSDARYISVYTLLNGTVTEFAQNYPDHLEKIDMYRKRLTGYDFSTIIIPDYPIDFACEVFTRINTSGTELTLFEIMVAKTYDPESGFDLANEYKQLIEGGNEKGLKDADYDTIPPSTILQCVSAYYFNQIRRKDILKVSRDDFIAAWDWVKAGIFSAVDYLRSKLRVTVSQLLPYNALLIPFTYFFVKNFDQKPNVKQEQLLNQYFWWVSLSNRYSSGLENKVAQDLVRIDEILKGNAPSYRGEEIQLTLDDIRWKWFSTSDSFCKAMLCLFTYSTPHSFDRNSPITLDNSWLKSTNSKNYHHFFPRSYLKKHDVPDWKANSILNITIVDDHLNKNKIRSKPPSEYMSEFMDENPEIEETMKTHLIDSLDDYGVWVDDFEKFIDMRGKRVIEEIQKRLQ
ncbi:MAG: hypothetical protein A2W35_13395 [Chloroflexi bacterium RBG_16_57_11]|nr:MAG: hypothetical protein A2W35_13395 [Chloroflexi bacterium RBG_16_57_11]